LVLNRRTREISPVHRHQPVKLTPWQMLQKSMKNAILMAHGIDPPSRVRIVGETSRTEWNQCHALVHKNSTGQPWARPGHPQTTANGLPISVDARHKAGHDGEADHETSE